MVTKTRKDLCERLVAASPPPRGYAAIYQQVTRIPSGRVATYGQVAKLAGLPGHARQVGYAMHRLPDGGTVPGSTVPGSTVPWHRVVNAQGRISERAEKGPEALQQAMLEAEGVQFRLDGSFDLERYRWRPRQKRQKFLPTPKSPKSQ